MKIIQINSTYESGSTGKICFNVSKLLDEKGIGLFDFKDRFVIRITSLYGKIRPYFRKVYYRLFKKVKTN